MERQPHHIRMDAVFDDASVGKARQTFASLDNILSRDAANRLRNSPQGSILGTLNSLFSPHPIAGAPSAQQAASQGLLGRITQGQQAAGGIPASGPMPRDMPQQQAIDQQQNAMLSRLAQQQQAQNQTNQRQTGLLASMLHGGGGGGAFALGGLLGHLFGGGGGGGGGGTAGGLARGIGPQILGLGLKTTGIVGGAGSLLGALPGAVGPLGALGLGGIGLGVGMLGFKAATQTVSPLVQQSQQIQQQLLSATGTQRTQLLQQQAQIQKSVSQMDPAMRSMFQSLNGINNLWQSIGQKIGSDFAGPLHVALQVFQSLAPLIERTFGAGARLITPFIQGLGDVARMVLPLLIQGFHIVQPAIRPLIDGLGRLVAGILPGLNMLVRASLPIIRPFAEILAGLGHDIGGLFAALAPAVKASEPIFAALMKVLGAIFPIIGSVAAAFAKVLGPVFVSLAKTLEQLLPILRPLGVLMAQLAAAILADLGSAFQAVLILIRDMEPSIRILAGALGSMFKVLENSGVFAIMGDALEKLAPLIAQLVNQFVRSIAPILPVVIKLFAQLSEILVTLLAAGLTVVLKGLAELVAHSGGLLKFLALATIAAYAFGAALSFISANPVVAIIGGIVLLIGIIVELVTHWNTVWRTIKGIASDAWNFIYNGFGKYLLPLLGPAGLIALGAIELAKHWTTVWDTIKGVTLDAWNWLQDNIWHPLHDLLFNDIPSWWDQAVKAIGDAWGKVEDVVKAPINFVIRYILDDGLIKAFNWISSKVGGPSIKPIPTLRSGGIVPGGWGGGDSQLIAAEPGETVIPKEHSRSLAWLWKLLGIPGYQGGGMVGRFPGLSQPKPGSAPFGGGVVGDIGKVLGKIFDVGKILAAIATGNSTALTNAFYALMGHGLGGAVGEMAALVTDIPKTLVKDAVHWLISQFSGSTGSPSGHYGGGVASPGLFSFARYLMAHGASRMAAAGAAGAVAGESGGNPEILQAGGGGGAGLLQWTPASSAFPIRPIITGNVGRDMAVQLIDALAYINSRGGVGALNSAAAARGIFGAAWRMSEMEAPAVVGSDIRMNAAQGIYRLLDRGGWLGPGPTLAWNATRGREAVLTPAQSDAFVELGEAARLFSRGTGRLGTGSLMRDVYLTLPEGTTVAQALSEITFRLRTAQMNGYGMVP